MSKLWKKFLWKSKLCGKSSNKITIIIYMFIYMIKIYTIQNCIWYIKPISQSSYIRSGFTWYKTVFDKLNPSNYRYVYCPILTKFSSIVLPLRPDQPELFPSVPISLSFFFDPSYFLIIFYLIFDDFALFSPPCHCCSYALIIII